MRIVCPVCGDEPKKGQRHICAPAVSSTCPEVVESADIPPREEPVSGAGVLHRRGLKATPNAVCASISSLIQKSPGLWRSTGALARCGGDIFVAGLLASAVSSASWGKDPKGTLIRALTRRVADEAAQAIQECWRSRRSSRAPRRPIKKEGYQQLALAAPRTATASPLPAQSGAAALPRKAPRVVPERGSTRGGDCGSKARPPPLSVVLPRTDHADHVSLELALLASQSPSAKPETPRNKSNPRPSGVRAVPMNPIQALKQRRAQQDRENEEKRIQQLLDAEESRATRARGGTGSVPASPQGFKALALPSALANDSVPSSADTEALDVSRMLAGMPLSGTSTPRCMQSGVDWFAASNVEQDFCQDTSAGVTAAALEAALTPFERRAARQALPSPRAAAMGSGARPPLPAGSVPGACSRTPVPMARGDGESQSAPNTLQQWRQATPPSAEGCPEARRASSASSSPRKERGPSAPRGEPTATARLRDRMRQREGLAGAPRAKSPGSAGRVEASGGWQDRIEARQREAEDFQEIEAQQRQQTEERSSRRNGALRKVMERQALRQEAVEGLEQGLQAC